MPVHRIRVLGLRPRSQAPRSIHDRSLDIISEKRIIPSNHIPSWQILADNIPPLCSLRRAIFRWCTVVPAVYGCTAYVCSRFPDKLCEVSCFFCEAGRREEVIFNGFVTPCADCCCCVGVAVGEVFAVGALLFQIALVIYVCVEDMGQ